MLIAIIVSRGNILAPLRLVRPAHLEKPGNDPHTRKFQRPISTINTIKFAEAAISNRIAHELDPTFHPTHSARRIPRGTYRHFAGVAGVTLTHVRQDHFVYLASFDM